MKSKRCLTAAILLVICLLLFSLISGCTDDGDLCLTTVYQIDEMENSANSRLQTMDISNPDEFVYAQAKACKDQYSQAIVMLTTEGAGECMADATLKNRLRSLELKYGLVDLFIRFGEKEESVSTLLYQSYPEFQINLEKSINSLESMKSELKVLQVMANDVDSTILNPGNQDILPVVDKDIDILAAKINMYLSELSEYQ